MRVGWVWLVLGVMVMMVACGSPEPGRDVPAARMAGVEPTPWGYVAEPTATAWPTFTPVATAEPPATAVGAEVPVVTTVPVRMETPSPTVVPTVGPLVATAVADTQPVLVTLEPGTMVTEVPEPAATPYGKVSGSPVVMRQQTVFPLQSTELPDYLESGDLSRWPLGSEVISRGVNFVVWAVAFDMSEVSEDFVLDGYVRWVQMTSEVDSVVMLESPVAITKAEPLFYEGLGRNYPGFWSPGVYRLEFLDGDYVPVVGWTFEVR